MKIDLKDATFIVPVRIESDDRLRNVITTLCFLMSNFDTNIIVHEVDKESIFEKDALPQINDYLDGDISALIHKFEHSNSPSFHRQKVLNDMLMEVNTSIVVNYDCDVLLPIESYLTAYNLLLSKKSDVVYPYGYGDYQKQIFADDELVSDFLNNDFDFKLLEAKSKIYMSQYGFVQFFNRQVYIDGGMENENFVAYAPEDVERFYRFTTLGYNVSRVDSLVYHLEHKRTENSWINNPHMQSNIYEWEKIKKMNNEELKHYILNQNYYKDRIHGQE
jgi:predicted glycosyltransferase involved in capsule biosynthesis